MKAKPKTRETFEELEKLAHDAGDVRPMSAAVRREWDAARRTGAKRRPPGRPRKDPELKSRIVPISIDPALLVEVDRFASAAGMTRSRLVSEALKLRMGV